MPEGNHSAHVLVLSVYAATILPMCYVRMLMQQPFCRCIASECSCRKLHVSMLHVVNAPYDSLAVFSGQLPVFIIKCTCMCHKCNAGSPACIATTRTHFPITDLSYG